MKGIYIRPERCLGCKSCQIECAVEHSSSKTLLGAMSESPAPRWRNFVEQSVGHAIPLICRHCEDAPCVAACVTGAMRRERSGVVTNVGREGRCIGCWSCVMACPYGVITPQHELRKAVKCDLCPGKEIPVCVQACPTGARVFAEPEEIAKSNREQAGSILLSSYSVVRRTEE